MKEINKTLLLLLLLVLVWNIIQALPAAAGPCSVDGLPWNSEVTYITRGDDFYTFTDGRLEKCE